MQNTGSPGLRPFHNNVDPSKLAGAKPTMSRIATPLGRPHGGNSSEATDLCAAIVENRILFGFVSQKAKKPSSKA